MIIRLFFVLFLAVGSSTAAQREGSPGPGFIRVSGGGEHFEDGAGKRFVPWGFNYDRDYQHRLLESYWESEWATVVEDFAEMKALGANVVRIHLQVAAFMESPTEANRRNLERLGMLLEVARTNGLYLDITGLGCYDKAAVPEWYDELGEAERWNVQARFWQAIAERCKESPAVFCYDLMNEPVVEGGKVEKEWLGAPLGKFHYVQRINLDPAGRTQKEIAKAWVDKLVAAIRQEDQEHLITVGVIPWAMVFPNAKPLFHSPEVSTSLDFVSVHFYPKSGEMDKALAALKGFRIGKPIVIEEMFPLACGVDELDQFIAQSAEWAGGWIGFYWGKTISEYESQDNRDIGEELTLGWLRYFAERKGRGPKFNSPLPAE